MPAGRPDGRRRRNDSLAPPSFTELLFAIGAGDHIVGRTQWCDYPLRAEYSQRR